MQTFLPYPSPMVSAAWLDNKRLNKQITEAYQIYLTLQKKKTEDKVPWGNHPAVLMWEGFENMLLHYSCFCYGEWIRRYDYQERNGNREHSAGEKLLKLLTDSTVFFKQHWWMGNEEFHSSHRSILLAKDFEHYSQFGWKETPAVKVNGSYPYVWPVRKEGFR